MIIILITINLDLVLLQVILNLEDNKLFNVMLVHNGGKADDGKTSIGEIKYTKLNKIGELTIYSPIES